MSEYPGAISSVTGSTNTHPSSCFLTSLHTEGVKKKTQVDEILYSITELTVMLTVICDQILENHPYGQAYSREHFRYFLAIQSIHSLLQP